MPNGCRKKLIHLLYRTFGVLWCFVGGVFASKKIIDVDYTEYLGPDYKKGYKDIKKTSTIVSNHVSWFDTMMLY